MALTNIYKWKTNKNKLINNRRHITKKFLAIQININLLVILAILLNSLSKYPKVKGKNKNDFLLYNLRFWKI